MDADRTDLGKLRAEFDQWAESYDLDVAAGQGVLEGYAGSRRRAAALVPVEPSAKVLDVGIGTGAFSDLFAERGAEITGVDISPWMLDLCSRAHPEFRLIAGDFTHLPLADGSQDLVVSSFAFHHLTDLERAEAILECMRVLRRDGAFLLVDIMFEDLPRLAAARARLGTTWDDENYPLFGELRELAARLSLAVRLEVLSDLHGAAIFRAAQPR